MDFDADATFTERYATTIVAVLSVIILAMLIADFHGQLMHQLVKLNVG